MYTTVEYVKRFLPPSITVGEGSPGQPVPGRPDSGDSKLSVLGVKKYIQFAQQEIDARLSPFYAVPLRMIKAHEVEPLNNITQGTSVRVAVDSSDVFTLGDRVRVQDLSNNELCEIESIPDHSSMVLDSVSNTYEVDESLISIVQFPNPIPVIAARLTVSYAFDEMFVAEQEPDVSQYGVNQRQLANNSLDSIMAGSVFLIGQEMVGRRFLRGTLYDGYSTPGKDFQFGREEPRG